MSKPYNPDYIEKVLICDKEALCDEIEGRYLLKLKLKNNCTDTLTIIMMNPSAADESIRDETVHKVYSFVFDENSNSKSPIKNIGYINILNLFAVYQPDSTALASVLDEVKKKKKLVNTNNKNKKAFEKAISSSGYVVLAWGDVPQNLGATVHNEKAIMAYNYIRDNEMINNTYVLKFKGFPELLTKDKRPRHPSRKTIIGYQKVKALEVKRKFLYISI